MTGGTKPPVSSVAAASVLSVLAFFAGNAYAATLSSMDGQWLFNLEPALFATPGSFASRGVSFGQGAFSRCGWGGAT